MPATVHNSIGPHQQEDGDERYHEETPPCTRPGPGGEWQTGATGDNRGVKRVVYQTRADTYISIKKTKVLHIGHQMEELDIELEGKTLTQGAVSCTWEGQCVEMERRREVHGRDSSTC